MSVHRGHVVSSKETSWSSRTRLLKGQRDYLVLVLGGLRWDRKFCIATHIYLGLAAMPESSSANFDGAGS